MAEMLGLSIYSVN